MGRRVSQILGGVARSPGRLPGENRSYQDKETEDLKDVSRLYHEHGPACRRHDLQRRSGCHPGREIFQSKNQKQTEKEPNEIARVRT